MRAGAVVIPSAIGFTATAGLAIGLRSWFLFVFALILLFLALAAPGRPILRDALPWPLLRRTLLFSLGLTAALLTLQFVGLPRVTRRGISLGIDATFIAFAVIAALILGVAILWVMLWLGLRTDPSPPKVKGFVALLATFLLVPVAAALFVLASTGRTMAPWEEVISNVIAPTTMMACIGVAAALPYLGGQGARVELAQDGPLVSLVTRIRPAPLARREATVRRAHARPDAAAVYRATLDVLARQGPIGPGERRALDALGWNLGLTPNQARELEEPAPEPSATH